jgi:hypothetical protein
MSETELQIREKAKEVRNYLIGDTGLGQQEPPYGPTRMTQIAGRRRAFLAGEEHNSAREGVRQLWLNPGQSIAELSSQSEGVCAVIMAHADRICQMAALDDHSAEVYMAAMRRGCDRLQTGVREALAECKGLPFGEVLNRVESIATDIRRWHEVREDDPDVRRRPL